NPLTMSDSALAALLFIQFAVILAVCRALGWAFARIRQPPVVAEMVAGFLLGPSLFGAVAPNLQARVFPAASLHTLPATPGLRTMTAIVFLTACVGRGLAWGGAARLRSARTREATLEGDQRLQLGLLH